MISANGREGHIWRGWDCYFIESRPERGLWIVFDPRHDNAREDR